MKPDRYLHIVKRAKPVCTDHACECDAPRIHKVNPINFLLKTMGQMALACIVVFVIVAFIFRVFTH